MLSILPIGWSGNQRFCILQQDACYENGVNAQGQTFQMHFNYFQCTVRTLIHTRGIMQIPLSRIYVLYPKALSGLKYTLVKLGVIIQWGNKSMPPYYAIRNLLLNLLVSMAMFHVYEGENVLIFCKQCYLQDNEKYDVIRIDKTNSFSFKFSYWPREHFHSVS